MKGALVFLAVFALLTLITIGSTTIPPGKALYDMLKIPDTPEMLYPVLGVPAMHLIIAVFNGVIYGIIVWLIYSLTLGRSKKEKVQVQVQVQKEEPKQEEEKPAQQA